MELNIYKNIGELIKAKREELDMTQDQLSKMVGLKASTISLYESGSRKPELKILYNLAKALKSSIIEFLDVDIPDADLNIALRAEKLQTQDIKKVREYIKILKYARRGGNKA